MNLKRGFIYCLVGPSGSGKTTLAANLRERGVNKIITTTTRQPREGEVNGVDYFFISEEEFYWNSGQDNFFEWQRIHNNLYGTSKTLIESFISEGKIGVIILDVSGAAKLKETYLEDVVTIFMTTNSIDILAERLELRNTTSEDFAARFQAAKEDLIFYNNNINAFDYLMYTNHTEDAGAVLDSLFDHELVKRGKQLKFNDV